MLILQIVVSIWVGGIFCLQYFSDRSLSPTSLLEETPMLDHVPTIVEVMPVPDFRICLQNAFSNSIKPFSGIKRCETYDPVKTNPFPKAMQRIQNEYAISKQQGTNETAIKLGVPNLAVGSSFTTDRNGRAVTFAVVEFGEGGILFINCSTGKTTSITLQNFKAQKIRLQRCANFTKALYGGADFVSNENANGFAKEEQITLIFVTAKLFCIVRKQSGGFAILRLKKFLSQFERQADVVAFEDSGDDFDPFNAEEKLHLPPKKKPRVDDLEPRKQMAQKPAQLHENKKPHQLGKPLMQALEESEDQDDMHTKLAQLDAFRFEKL